MTYFVQEGNDVKQLTEQELRRRLRKNKFSGLELVRRSDELQWRPLHETHLFVEEVPFQGLPADAARWRKFRGFAVHFAVYLTVNAIIGFVTPILVFWGIGIVVHGSRALPAFLSLYGEGKIPYLPRPRHVHALPPAGDPPHPPPQPPAGHPPHPPPQPSTTARTTTAPQPVVPMHALAGPHTQGTQPPTSLDVGLQPTIAENLRPPADRSVPDIEDRHLRASVRRKLFGEQSAELVRIGRYRLLERIGAGGMGVVYRALDEALDRPVAIKLLRPEQDVDQGTERLQREARAIARVSHPNVVTVYDVGEVDGGVFVAMEFVEGETLRQWCKRPHPAGDILRVLVQAAEGVAAAHAAGLVHRDFKPENVMVGHDGRVRVLDFGLAKPTDRGGDTLTRTGTLLGTPRYMAPEQLRGDPADRRSDQFAIGVVFYEALYGTHPYQPTGDRTISQAVLAGALRSPPTRADVPEAVRQAILTAVAHDPSDRHASIGDFLHSLGPLPTSRDALASMAAAVRRLIARRPAETIGPMLATLDDIERVVAELDAKASLLERHTSQAEVDGLRRELETVRARMNADDATLDAALLRQQATSLQQRLDGIERAREMLERLRTRRRIAETQLEQLHLDLARAEASDASLPDLTAPLQELRFEVDAAQEVEALLRS